MQSFPADKNERRALVILTCRIVPDDLTELFIAESNIVASSEDIAGEVVRVNDDARYASFFFDLVAYSVWVLRERNTVLSVNREDIRIEAVKSADFFADHVVEDAFLSDELCAG